MHLRKRPFEEACISAITSVISASWPGIVSVASAKADLTGLLATSLFLLTSALSSCLQVCSSAHAVMDVVCAISVVKQGYERAEDPLFLLAVLLHSCLPPVARSLLTSQHADTVAHLLRLVD